MFDPLPNEESDFMLQQPELFCKYSIIYKAKMKSLLDAILRLRVCNGILGKIFNSIKYKMKIEGKTWAVTQH
jgi:hypothetical protein